MRRPSEVMWVWLAFWCLVGAGLWMFSIELALRILEGR